MKGPVVVLGAVAFLVAGVSGLMLSNYLDRPIQEIAQAPQAAKPRTVSVLVAKDNYEPGDAADTGVAWATWPDAVGDSVASTGGTAVPDDDKAQAAKDAAEKDLAGTIFRVRVSKGQVVTADMVVHPDKASALSAMLHPGMRAVTISVDNLSSLSGQLQPGDIVDIILSLDLTEAGAGVVDASGIQHPKVATETVFHNMRILTVDRRLAPPAQKSGDKAAAPPQDAPAPSTVTIETTPKLAEKLVTAARIGHLQMVLTPMAKGTDGELDDLVTDTQVSRRLQDARASGGQVDAEDGPPFPAPPPVTAAEPQPTVTIYRWTNQTVYAPDGTVISQSAPPAGQAAGTALGDAAGQLRPQDMGGQTLAPQQQQQLATQGRPAQPGSGR
jgi:pilus assembly protein CpaB